MKNTSSFTVVSNFQKSPPLLFLRNRGYATGAEYGRILLTLHPGTLVKSFMITWNQTQTRASQEKP